MDKKTINRLKVKNKKVKTNWSTKELKELKELKDNGIFPSIITNDEYTMSMFFPHRTKAAVKKKYDEI